jgi:hypothetical protein
VDVRFPFVAPAHMPSDKLIEGIRNIALSFQLCSELPACREYRVVPISPRGESRTSMAFGDLTLWALLGSLLLAWMELRQAAKEHNQAKAQNAERDAGEKREGIHEH